MKAINVKNCIWSLIILGFQLSRSNQSSIATSSNTSYLCILYSVMISLYMAVVHPKTCSLLINSWPPGMAISTTKPGANPWDWSWVVHAWITENRQPWLFLFFFKEKTCISSWVQGGCPGLTRVRNQALVVQGAAGLRFPNLQVGSVAAQGSAFQYYIKELELFYPTEEWLPSAVPESYPANRPQTGVFVMKNYRSAWDHWTKARAG